MSKIAYDDRYVHFYNQVGTSQQGEQNFLFRLQGKSNIPSFMETHITWFVAKFVNFIESTDSQIFNSYFNLKQNITCFTLPSALKETAKLLATLSPCLTRKTPSMLSRDSNSSAWDRDVFALNQSLPSCWLGGVAPLPRVMLNLEDLSGWVW